MGKIKEFNADQKTKELLDSPITIGKETFRPARLTPDVRRNDIQFQVENSKLIREQALDRDASKPGEVTEQQLEARADGLEVLDNRLYERIANLIRGENGEEPAKAFLVEHVDQRVANEMLDWLLDPGDEEQAGESAQPAEAG